MVDPPFSARLKQVLDVVPVPIVVTRAADGTILLANTAACEYVGLPESEYVGSRASSFYADPEDRGRLTRALREQGRVQGMEVQGRPADGEEAWASMSAFRMEMDGEDVLVVSLVDITPVKRAETALRQSEARLKQAQRVGHTGHWEWDIATGALTWSDHIYRIFGVEEREFEPTYEAFLDSIHADDWEAVTSAVERAVEEDEPYRMEYRVVRPDGTVRHVLDQGEVTRNEEGEPLRMLGVVSDVTESRNLAAQLLQAQKMEALGLMAGGIAHNFNNILTAVRANAELLSLDSKVDGTAQGGLQQILLAADRAAEMVDQLLAFSRNDTQTVTQVDLNEVVDETTRLFRGVLEEKVKVEVDLCAEPCPVDVDRSQLAQIVVNLGINARDAMPLGGSLAIATSSEHRDGGEPWVVLRVRDTGEGMDEEVVRRIFEPFYTTKPVDRGTGLGLSTVYGIVTRAGGDVSVSSIPEEGTEFVISLPAARRP